MIDGWLIVGVALLYIGGLFALAWVGDRRARKTGTTAGRPMVYALSLAVYCTSWTFFGSVGLAATTGFDFIPVYIGPILMFLVGQPLLLKVASVAKSQNLTSVADFMSARYGKSFAVAAVVTVVAMLGLMPYIALQLKAISVSIEIAVGASGLSDGLLRQIGLEFFGVADTAFLITIALALFAILFGTRRIEATESQEGLMLAVAAESVVKLFAFIVVGVFTIYGLFGGVAAFATRLAETPQVLERFTQGLNGGSWLTVTLLSFTAILLLPRQFHVTIVENRSEAELKRARWMFPLYLVLINLFVVPIAAGGLMTFTVSGRDPDFYMLALPMAIDSKVLTVIAFLGGLSAATAMVIVESVALSIMVCNSLVVPLLLRRNAAAPSPPRDMGDLLMRIRRITIAVLLLLGYIVYHTLGHSRGLAAIGLLSFAAVAQFAPAFFLGLIWRKGTARGAIAGMLAGTGVWAYTLVLPWVVSAGWFPQDILNDGPLGITMLRPQALFFLQFEPLTHGVLWSLSANLLTYLFLSVLRPPLPIERLQAQMFVEDEVRPAQMPAYKLWRSNISLAELESCVGRYLGVDRAQRSFQEFLASRNALATRDAEADIPSVRFAENLLSSAIGAASARLVLTLLLKRGSVSNQSAMRLLDDASEALQYNRDLLQSALDQVRHGLSVFDKDMRLICWNRQFRELLDLPADIGRVGTPLDRILRICAERGDFGPGDIDRLIESRIYRLAVRKETFQERILDGRRQIEIRTSSMPQGGIVTTFSDITDRVAAANALARANASLERRVRERTAELLEVNAALAVAKSKADQANLDKTRFLAAASHDILQPLNAARLYATSLVERPLDAKDLSLANNVDASLSAVEEIFSALIEISRMDAGRLEPEPSEFPLAEMFAQLKVEFAPMAREKNIDLRTFETQLWVRSDRRLLRRVLQNLISNAIKYTRSGSVLLGARARGDSVVVQVLDTGPGIPEDKRTVIFKEFQRLEGPGSNVRGLGLGLSIVERICRVLDHPIHLVSRPMRGSNFSVRIPRAEPRHVAAPAVVPQPSPGNLAGCAVLCIDNEPVVLSGMETLLAGWGCNVRTAPSAAEALSVLAGGQHLPDIILADYHLDSGTGIDAIVRIRKEFDRPIPAVLITADHSLEVQREVRAHDIPLLRKPLKAGSLRAILSKIVIARQAAAE